MYIEKVKIKPLMNKRQALFWSVQMWRIIEKHHCSKSDAIHKLDRYAFKCVDSDYISAMFAWAQCSCCTYIDSNFYHAGGIIDCSKCIAIDLWTGGEKDHGLDSGSICQTHPDSPFLAYDAYFEDSKCTFLPKDSIKQMADWFEAEYMKECQKS